MSMDMDGRHRGKNGDRQCKLCGDECESVVHVYVLCECPVLEILSWEKLLGGVLRSLVDL